MRWYTSARRCMNMRRFACHALTLSLTLAAAATASCARPAERQGVLNAADILIPLDPNMIEARVPRHATLETILRDENLPADFSAPLVTAVREVFNPRHIRANQPYQVIRTLDGLFRYTAITPFILTPGTHYVVGAFTTDLASSLGTDQGGTGSINPLVTVHVDRYSDFDATFSFPTEDDGHANGAWLGGNFNLVAGAPGVPEPASWAMMIGGFALAGAALRSRAKLAFAA